MEQYPKLDCSTTKEGVNYRDVSDASRFGTDTILNVEISTAENRPGGGVVYTDRRMRQHLMFLRLFFTMAESNANARAPYPPSDSQL